MLLPLKKPVKAIFFDLDGVLVNSYDAWFRLFNDTLQHFGYRKITKKEFNREWGKSTKEDVKYFMPRQTVPEVRAYYSKAFPRFIRYVKVTPGAPRVLGVLRKRGYRLGCVTNSHQDITRQMLRQAGIDRYFDLVICADEVRRPKPAPDMLNKARKLMGLKPDEVIFIGDTRTDLVAGRRAGLVTIGYRIGCRRAIQSITEIVSLCSPVNRQAGSSR
jgi:HAD superfamily hydrolase (TIGR01509 family)